MIDDAGLPSVLEINTSPGMTRTSLFPDSAAHAGLDFAHLVSKIIDCALEKYKI